MGKEPNKNCVYYGTDIHYSEHKIKRVIKKIKREPGLSEEDRNAILEYSAG
jgi:hypothetical protein